MRNRPIQEPQGSRASHLDGRGETADSVVLWWIPAGARGCVVRHAGAWWERAHAVLAGRAPEQLFHTALEVTRGAERFVIEMTPAASGPPAHERGVVRTGPVVLRFLRWSRWFCYEVRCWQDGTIAAREWAVGGPIVVSSDRAVAERTLELVGSVPALTWGRDPLGSGDMWNCNALVAWLLAGSGADVAAVAPPLGGRAPGWATGLVMAQRTSS